MKKLILITLLSVSVGAVYTNAQSLIVQYQGTDNSVLLESLYKFSFSEDDFILEYLDGTTETYSVSEINKLFFESVVTTTKTIEKPEDSEKIISYPNPAQEIVYFKELPEETSTAIIYRIDGVIILQAQISTSKNYINIENLKSGIYYLKINNSISKFIKL